MREIFRICFELIIDPLTLPVNPLAEWIILALINKVVYKLAFGMVGDLYWLDIIDGRFIGSFLHWLFRTALFLVIWALTNLVINAYHFVAAHWLAFVGVVVGIWLLVAIIVLIYKYFWKEGISY